MQALCDFHRASKPTFAFLQTATLAEVTLKELSVTIKVVAVKSSQRRDQLLPEPRLSIIKRWRNQQRLRNARAQSSADDDGTLPIPTHDTKRLYDLPRGTPEFPTQRKFGGSLEVVDACKTLKYLRFSKHLKSLEDAGVAMRDCIDAACDDVALRDQVLDQLPDFPKKSALNHGRMKLDAVTMNIERREFQHLIDNEKENVVSCHLYTDGSPVTGSEMQGMVLDICMLTGIVFTYVLPGCVMHYGMCRAIDKVFAFLWSLHLVIGVSFPDLDWLIKKIKSVTTDMGIEFGVIDAPDILKAFLRRRMGVPMSLLAGTVDLSSRLFCEALRISGWGHTFGNIMYFACKCFARWPEMLSHIRVLLRFFKNPTWRERIADALSEQFPEARLLLKSFTASLAKWRYETVDTCLGQLFVLRRLCQEFLHDIDRMFPQFQDKELLIDVRTACRFKDLWTFIGAFYAELIHPLELARRWGLVCSCCSALRHAGAKQSKCPRSSRRIREARAFLDELINNLVTNGNDLESMSVKCEGVGWVCTGLSLALRRTGRELNTKTGYRQKAPWRVSECDDPIQAAECAKQLRALPDDISDPLLRRYKSELLPLLDVLVHDIWSAYIHTYIYIYIY